MKRSRFTEEQIIGIRREVEAGAQIRERSRRHGITEQTFWRTPEFVSPRVVE